VAVNTAALPEQLLETELFGHELGAFTGAVRSRKGAFELAHGGTIFLDEIGEMAPHLQAKLLRVLQDYEVKPIGSESPIWVDVRVLASTNQDLEKQIIQGNFRKDLYYRLGVVILTIPPLRHRKEDIPFLARRFVSFYRHEIGREVDHFSEPAMEALCRHDWPGNVRELMNAIERAMLLCKSDEISINDLPDFFHHAVSQPQQVLPGVDFMQPEWMDMPLPEVQKRVFDQVERSYIELVLKKTNGRVGRAAKLAGIHPRGFYNKMKHFGLHKEEFRQKK